MSEQIPSSSPARSVKLAFYFACRSLGLFRVARHLTRKHLKILCYHGFEMKDEASFRPKLFIRASQFERRLATIKRYGLQVLPLDEAVERMYAGTLPPDAVTITIDDGFRSVHDKALPLLRRFGYPATVYVTTYYVERANPVFRLAVQYMFATTALRSLEVANEPWCVPGVLDLSDADKRQDAAWACVCHGEQQGEEERVALCERLGRMLGTPYAEVLASGAFNLMTPQQLATLERSGVAVELHTHRHVLPPDDRRAVHREIRDNREALQRWIGRAPRHFCYPSGLFDLRQWEWLDEMEVKSSTTCLPGLNSARTPRHGLHRFLDGANIDQLEFEAALSGFSDLLRACLHWRPRRPAGAPDAAPASAALAHPGAGIEADQPNAAGA